MQRWLCENEIYIAIDDVTSAVGVGRWYLKLHEINSLLFMELDFTKIYNYVC